MKRCPHCGVQDHDEAILCKSCMRSFAAPPASHVRGQTTARPNTLIATAVVRLILLVAVIYTAVQFDLPSKLLARFNEWQQGQQETPPEEPPAAAPPVAEVTPAAPAATEPAAPSPPPPPPAPAAPAPEPATAAVEPSIRREPARPTPAPPRAAPAPVRKAESRPSQPPPTAAPAPAPAPPAPPVQPLRVGGNIKAPAKVRDVRPEYPAAAQSSRIQGIVIIEATIGADGRVRETRVLRPVSPLLDDAAVEAVRQWEYEPTLLNGVAVPVIMTVTVNFRLQ